MSQTVTGKIKFFYQDKGFGFVECQGRPDHWVSQAVVRQSGFRFDQMVRGATIEFTEGVRHKKSCVESIVSINGKRPSVQSQIASAAVIQQSPSAMTYRQPKPTQHKFGMDRGTAMAVAARLKLTGT